MCTDPYRKENKFFFPPAWLWNHFNLTKECVYFPRLSAESDCIILSNVTVTSYRFIYLDDIVKT